MRARTHTQNKMGDRCPFPRVKRPECEADHSLPFTAKMNAWIYTSTPQYTFLAWCSVKAQGTFTFTLE